MPALLYLLFVYHYSLNVPIADDWNVIGLAAAGVHHQLTFSLLWAEYGDTRLLVGFSLFVVFGIVDHLNEKSVILFSAGMFIVTFALLLVQFRSYLGRQLTFWSALSIGIVWFSLAEVQNSLWSFQFPWYFVVFAFVLMTYLLLVPSRFRGLCLGLGIHDR